MKTTRSKRPLAFQLRRARRLHNGRGVSQREAAIIADVPERTIRAYEHATDLPRSVRALLCLARTYGVPIDALIDHDLNHEVTKKVEQRRTEFELHSP